MVGIRCMSRTTILQVWPLHNNVWKSRVNNLPPEISLVGNSFFVESNGEIIFDASASGDPYWGREGIGICGSCEKPS